MKKRLDVIKKTFTMTCDMKDIKLARPADITPPPPKEILPMQYVSPCKVLCSAWMLWIVPASLVLGYGFSPVLYHIATLCGLEGGAAVWVAILISSAICAACFFGVELWCRAIRENKEEAQRKGMSPAIGAWGGYGNWLWMGMVLLFVVAGCVTGRYYDTARTYGHTGIMRAATVLVPEQEQEQLFREAIQDGDAAAQNMWLDMGLPRWGGLQCFELALSYGQHDAARRILEPILARGYNDRLTCRVAFSLAVQYDAPMDIILALAPYFHENDRPFSANDGTQAACFNPCGIISSLADDDLRALARRCPAFATAVRQNEHCRRYLVEIRHLDPDTLQPLATHGN